MPFLLYGQDCYRNFRERAASIPFCPGPECGLYLNSFDLPFPGTTRPRYDMSCIANEGYPLASPKLMNVLSTHCATPVETRQTGGGYFVLRPKSVVQLNLSRGVSNTGTPCTLCGRPPFHTFLGRRFLSNDQSIDAMGLYRTAQEFGNHNQMRYDLLVGDGLADVLQTEKIKGAVFVRCDVYKRPGLLV